MIDLRAACKAWYFNDKVELRESVAWEILKDIRSHSADFKGRDAAINRFYRIGDFSFLLGQLKERFVDGADVYWDFYRSIRHIRLTKTVGGKVVAADVNEDFDVLGFGFDIPLDFDNVAFKAWFNERRKSWIEDKVANPFPSVEECREKCDATLADCKKAADKMAALLDQFKAPYVYKCSGTGFHVMLDWKDLREHFLSTDFGTANKAFASFLIAEAFKGQKCEYWDPSTVGEGRGLIRADYTLNPKVARVCLPLKLEAVENFKPDLVNYDTVLNSLRTPHTKLPFNHKRPGRLDALVQAFKGSKQADKLHAQKEKAIAKRDELKKSFQELSQKEQAALLAELQAEATK